MILSNEREVEAFVAGLAIGARLKISTVQALYQNIQIGSDTDKPFPKNLPWLIGGNNNPTVTHAPTEQHSSANIPPDAPHGFGIRQPQRTDPTDAPLDEPGRRNPGPLAEDSGRD